MNCEITLAEEQIRELEKVLQMVSIRTKVYSCTNIYSILYDAISRWHTRRAQTKRERDKTTTTTTK